MGKQDEGGTRRGIRRNRGRDTRVRCQTLFGERVCVWLCVRVPLCLCFGGLHSTHVCLCVRGGFHSNQVHLRCVCVCVCICPLPLCLFSPPWQFPASASDAAGVDLGVFLLPSLLPRASLSATSDAQLRQPTHPPRRAWFPGNWQMGWPGRQTREWGPRARPGFTSYLCGVLINLNHSRCQVHG